MTLLLGLILSWLPFFSGVHTPQRSNFNQSFDLIFRRICWTRLTIPIQTIHLKICWTN